MADLKGLKIRVPAVELQLAAFRSWGVEPHPLSWSETFNALQQGVVDGQENPYAIIRDQKFWEVQKYITDLHYMHAQGARHTAGPLFHACAAQRPTDRAALRKRHAES